MRGRLSWFRLLGLWIVIALAMIVNGVFRETVLAPLLDRTGADVASAVIGLAIILGFTRSFFRPLTGEKTARLVGASVLLVVLTVAFELLFGHYVDRKSWSELAANYAIWRGRLWPILLLAVAVSPILWTRWLPGREARR